MKKKLVNKLDVEEEKITEIRIDQIPEEDIPLVASALAKLIKEQIGSFNSNNTFISKQNNK